MSEAAAAPATSAPADTSAPTAGSAILSGGVSGNGSAPAAPPVSADGQGHNSGGAFDKDGNWRSFFSEGLDETYAKDWNNWSSRYDSPQNFAKGYVELRKNAVIVPKDDAKPEAWDEVYNRLGRPKSPADYKFNWAKDVPALQPAEVEAQESLRSVLYRSGANQKTVDALITWNGEQRKVMSDSWDVSAKTKTDHNVKVLKSAWGPDFDANVNIYNTTLKNYAGQNYDSFKTMRLDDGSFLADHPSFVQLMTKVGRERAEDDMNPSSFNASARESAQEQITKLENEALAKGLNPTSQGWPHAQLDPLYKKVHGSKPMGPGQIYG